MSRDRNEWIMLMHQLRETNRAAYDQLKAEGWARIAAAHKLKTPEQIEAWNREAS